MWAKHAGCCTQSHHEQSFSPLLEPSLRAPAFDIQWNGKSSLLSYTVSPRHTMRPCTKAQYCASTGPTDALGIPRLRKSTLLMPRLAFFGICLLKTFQNSFLNCLRASSYTSVEQRCLFVNPCNCFLESRQASLQHDGQYQVSYSLSWYHLARTTWLLYRTSLLWQE